MTDELVRVAMSERVAHRDAEEGMTGFLQKHQPGFKDA
jgi:hypothetical protein